MRQVVLIALSLAACVPPQQPSYYQQGQQQPQPYGQQPQPGYAAAQPVASATCHDTLDCYGTCNPMTEACITTCDQRTTPDSAQNAHAVLQCMAQSGCQDQNCVVQRCGAQITTCTNMTLAVAPTQPMQPTAPPAPPAGDPVMQPEYNSVHQLMIPPPRRILQQADLAGEWKRGNGAVASYATSNGSYAGFDSVSIGTAWNIDDSGGLHEKFTAAYSGYSSGHAAVQENNVGTFTIDNRNIVRLYRPAQNGNRESTDFYIVVGWFVGPEMIIMKLNGPYHGSITEKDISNASVNMYNSIPYVKKR